MSTDPIGGRLFILRTVDSVDTYQVCLLKFLGLDAISGPSMRFRRSKLPLTRPDLADKLPSKTVFPFYFLSFTTHHHPPIFHFTSKLESLKFSKLSLPKFFFLSIVLCTVIMFGSVGYCLNVHLNPAPLQTKVFSISLHFEFLFIVVSINPEVGLDCGT